MSVPRTDPISPRPGCPGIHYREITIACEATASVMVTADNGKVELLGGGASSDACHHASLILARGNNEAST